MKKFLLAITVLTCALISVKAQQLAFPGAEGYGAYATGGRGCQFYTSRKPAALRLPGAVNHHINTSVDTCRACHSPNSHHQVSIWNAPLTMTATST